MDYLGKQKRTSIAIPHSVKTTMTNGPTESRIALETTPLERYVALLVNAINIDVLSRSLVVRDRSNRDREIISCLDKIM